MPSPISAAANRFGDVTGASASPATSQPSSFSQVTSQPPVKPVWPVTKTRCPRSRASKSSETGRRSSVMRAFHETGPMIHRLPFPDVQLHIRGIHL